MEPEDIKSTTGGEDDVTSEDLTAEYMDELDSTPPSAVADAIDDDAFPYHFGEEIEEEEEVVTDIRESEGSEVSSVASEIASARTSVAPSVATTLSKAASNEGGLDDEYASTYEAHEEQMRRQMYQRYAQAAHLAMFEFDKVDSLGRLEDHVQPTVIQRALDLTWMVGRNVDLNIIFVRDASDTKSILYSCGHTVILYDFLQNTQKILRGHKNALTAMSASPNRQWLVTADKGEESNLNVWDIKTGVPIKTFFNMYPPDGICSAAISDDCKFIAVLTATATQKLIIMEWSIYHEEFEVVLCETEINESCGIQRNVQFSPHNSHHIISCSYSHTIFYQWHRSGIEYSSLHVARGDDATRSVGKILKVHFHFLPTSALASTKKGYMVVCTNDNVHPEGAQKEWHARWKIFKVIPLRQWAITSLQTIDKYIVIADEKGFIEFFDAELHLISWMEAYKNVPITSISFSPVYFRPDFSDRSAMSTDVTIQAKQFVCRDFVFCTAAAAVGHVTKNTLKTKIIVHDCPKQISAIAANPHRPLFCLGSPSGLLRVCNYKEKQIVSERQMGRPVTCLAYDQVGRYIGVGFQDGHIAIVDPLTLLEIWSPKFIFTNQAIHFCTFSHNGAYIAVADESRAVALMYFKQPNKWVVTGKFRGHSKPIVSLLFAIHPETKQPELFSLGKDRMLVEYDILKSKEEKKVIMASRHRLEQSAIPQGMLIYPEGKRDSFVMITNDQYKLKVFNMATKLCRKVALGPMYGEPIHRMALVPKAEWHPKTLRFLAFSTENLLGLQILPPDGNPFGSMVVHAHPNNLDEVVCSPDGRYIFTLDGQNACVGIWQINPRMVEAYRHIGGLGIEPYLHLLEGGRKGTIFTEVEDYFYYIHILKQGEDCMDTRAISRTIPVEEIPFVMRALGYYPSEEEIAIMLNEIKYSQYTETGRYVTSVDMKTFLKLYVNHRPALGLKTQDIYNAFYTLRSARNENGHPIIFRSHFLHILQTGGEHMTTEELLAVMSVLVQLKTIEPISFPEIAVQAPEGSTSVLLEEIEPSPSEAEYTPPPPAADDEVLNAIEEKLPSALTFELLMRDILATPEEDLVNFVHPGDDIVMSESEVGSLSPARSDDLRQILGL